jgi:hypothetical protein
MTISGSFEAAFSSYASRAFLSIAPLLDGWLLRRFIKSTIKKTGIKRGKRKVEY